jgi:hypothetical protein
MGEDEISIVAVGLDQLVQPAQLEARVTWRFVRIPVVAHAFEASAIGKLHFVLPERRNIFRQKCRRYGDNASIEASTQTGMSATTFLLEGSREY